jgi:hypothetical protein
MTCSTEPSPPEAKLLKAKPGKTMKGIANAARRFERRHVGTLERSVMR